MLDYFVEPSIWVHFEGPSISIEPIEMLEFGIDINMGERRVDLEIALGGEGPPVIYISASTFTFEPAGASTFPPCPIVAGLVSMPRDFLP